MFLRELFGIYNEKCPFALNKFATNNERGEQQPTKNNNVT